MKINSSVKDWLLESCVPIAETASGVRHDEEENLKYPYLVFTDIMNYDGSDEVNLFIRHSLYLYYYTESETDSTIEAWLAAQNIKFSCDKTYLDDDDCYEIEFVINEDIITKL